MTCSPVLSANFVLKWAVGVSLLLAAAHASGAATVEVVIDPECVTLNADQIGKLSELDLKEEVELQQVRVRIKCSGPAIHVLAHISPDNTDHERILSARLLEQTGAERTIAVTVSQMVLADRFRLDVPLTPPAPPPIQEHPRLTSRLASERPKPRVGRVQGDVAVLRRGGARGVVSRALGASAAVTLSGPLWLEAHGFYERAQFQRSLGNIDARAFGLRVGPSLVVTRGRLEVHTGGFASVGFTTLTGHASAGNRDDDVKGLSAAVDACFGPTFALGSLTLSARGLLGYAFVNPAARTRGDADASMGGPYFGGLGNLGVSFDL